MIVSVQSPFPILLDFLLKSSIMKTMTCRQLGGACDIQFHANSFPEIAEQSKKHGMEMFQKGDEKHIKAMSEMKQLMTAPDAMKEWFENKRKQLPRTSPERSRRA